jgi:hypothetical protein
MFSMATAFVLGPGEIHDGAEPFREPARRCDARFALHVRYLEGREHLPIVSLHRAA